MPFLCVTQNHSSNNQKCEYNYCVCECYYPTCYQAETHKLLSGDHPSSVKLEQQVKISQEQCTKFLHYTHIVIVYRC